MHLYVATLLVIIEISKVTPKSPEVDTSPKTDMEPANGWLDKMTYIFFWMTHLQAPCFVFWGVNSTPR